ncbi:MAG: hypothetical protein QOH26_340 [Actinomycetota bacterium]|jgi:predicted acetyltransferase|nr:hypothetical protein [Actinomycetota bacterium]
MDRFIITTEVAFGDDVRPETLARLKRVLEPERCFAAWDGDDLVGAGANYTFTLAIPGGSIPAAGVTMIGVLPTHRRRGILTKIMDALTEDAVARGEHVAILWASESGIYQRFGYGLATKQLHLEAEKKALVWLDDKPMRSRGRFLSEDETFKTLPEIYDRIQPGTPGFYVRTPEWWRSHRILDEEHHREGKGPMHRVALELDGRAEAYALYRSEHVWNDVPRNKLHVIEALGTTDEATREIWKYLFTVDLVETVTTWWLPIDHPLLLMVAEPPRLGLKVMNDLWLRIIDVEGAIGARSYAAEDSIVLDIADPGRPANAGRWRVDSNGSTPMVARTEDAADLQLSIADLGALYLGGSTMTQLLAAGRGRELTPGVAARVDALFLTPRAPYCTEIF